MTEYLTEQEQVELLKNWIKQYAFVIIAGVVIAVVAITGWRYWQQRQAKILRHASSVYDEMLTKRLQNNSAATYVQSHKLVKHYPKTPYGQMGALMLAKEAIAKKNYAEAEKQLKWVLENSSVTSFKQIARIRLSRIYIEQNSPEKAIALLQTVDDKSFNGYTEEVKGDAYLKQKNTTMAREAYRKALAELPNAEAIRPLLQMKFDNLAG